MSYANNKGADQPAHPHSLTNGFVVRCLDSKIPTLATFKISRLQLDSEAEQVDLSLTWSENTEDRVSRDVAHFVHTVDMSDTGCPIMSDTIFRRIISFIKAYIETCDITF